MTVDRLQMVSELNVCFPFLTLKLCLNSHQRSHSAFSLSANDPPGLIEDSSQTLKAEGGGSALSAWKSVDRLDNAGKTLLLIALTFKSRVSTFEQGHVVWTVHFNEASKKEERWMLLNETQIYIMYKYN